MCHLISSYQTGEEAVKSLNLPPHNPGTAVRKVNVSPDELISGPRTPKPQPWKKTPGTGEEYHRGPFPD